MPDYRYQRQFRIFIHHRKKPTGKSIAPALPATRDPGGSKENRNDTGHFGSRAAGATTLVIPGEMAARVDRLPMSFMAWEICLIIQVGWATSASTDGIALRLYPFVWLPAKVVTHSQYNVLFALQVGISILLGGYALGWLADKIGRRPALILSASLAAVFIWPFAYVTNYPALFALSIADTLGFAGFLAINVVYMSEIMGPTWRPKVMMPCQAVCIFLLNVVIAGIIPHYWFPVHYRWFLWLLAGLNALVAVALFFRMPESPRWLEARERRDQARQVVERMEARVMKRHPVLPEPDLTPYEVVAQEKTPWWAPFARQYVVVTVFLLVVMALGYGGIVYGGASQVLVYLTVTAATAPGSSSPWRRGPAWSPPPSTCSTHSSANGLSADGSSWSALSCSPAPTGAYTKRTVPRPCTPSTPCRSSA